MFDWNASEMMSMKVVLCVQAAWDGQSQMLLVLARHAESWPSWIAEVLVETKPQWRTCFVVRHGSEHVMFWLVFKIFARVLA